MLHPPNVPPGPAGSGRAGGRCDRPYGEGIRRLALLAAFGALVACFVVTAASSATAAGPDRTAGRAAATTETTLAREDRLPRTDLEAEQRDNGHTSQAPYLIWSGIASVVVVGGGGLLLKRRQDREAKA